MLARGAAFPGQAVGDLVYLIEYLGLGRHDELDDGLPMASSAAYPNMRSAAGFQLRTRPSMSHSMTARGVWSHVQAPPLCLGLKIMSGRRSIENPRGQVRL